MSWDNFGLIEEDHGSMLTPTPDKYEYHPIQPRIIPTRRQGLEERERKNNRLQYLIDMERREFYLRFNKNKN